MDKQRRPPLGTWIIMVGLVLGVTACKPADKSSEVNPTVNDPDLEINVTPEASET